LNPYHSRTAFYWKEPPLDYIAISTIVLYLGGVTAVGAFMVRKSKGSTEWAVAGGGMSGALVAFALAGSRIGGAGTYGVAGAVIDGGVWNMWWYGISSLLAMAFVGLFFAVYYRRLGLQTVAELFAVRFGSRRCQWLTSFCVQTEYAIVNVIEAYVIGVILSSLTPLTMFQGVLIAAAVFSTYVSLGGIWGTAVTNVIHSVVILVSLLAVGVSGVREMGGWDAVTLQVDARLAASPAHSQAGWWGFAGAGWLPAFGMLFAAAIHSPAASIYANFSTATRSERSLAPAFIVGGMIAALMPILAGVIGILAVAQYGLDAGLAGYDNITAIASEISPLMGGIAIAAVLAAVISSGGPILLSSATMLVRDWMPSSAGYSSERRLRTYRLVTVCYAVVAALVAWWFATQTEMSILDLLLFGFAMVVPPAISVAFTLYWRRTTEEGAFWGMLIGYASGGVWFVLIKWALWVGLEAPQGSSALREFWVSLLTRDGVGLDPSYVTTLIPLITVPLVSILTRSREADGGAAAEALFRERLRGVEVQEPLESTGPRSVP
jgi:SSS family solute:Na+ symporter